MSNYLDKKALDDHIEGVDSNYFREGKENQGQYFINCPLCNNEVLVYPWSFHNGKKCPKCKVVFRPRNIKNFYIHDKENYISIQEEYEKIRLRELPKV